jgi:hypothetical protein
MFPMTHIWFSRRVLGCADNTTVLGSVFPDTVIKCCLTYDQTHNGGWGLYRYFKENVKEHYSFARAMATHTVNPRGLDFYGDEEYGKGYKGYCFQKAAAIETEVIEACNIPEKFGLWKAHNFIEMGIEMNIAASDNELIGIFHSALTDKYLIRELAGNIGAYFGCRAAAVEDCFSKFTDFMELKELSSTALARRYDAQMQAKHGLRIDIQRSSDIIENCRSIVKEDFDGFIDFCTEQVKVMLEEEY